MTDDLPHDPERLADEARVARALCRDRPRPSRQFGARLRRRLLALDADARQPLRLRLLIGAYLSCGTVLLALAALGAGGHGPFS